MPAYSFKERFVPFVKDGSKPGTIRAFRKFRVKAGQLAHLFYGMRTKFCTKLVDPSPVIRKVVCIYFSENWEVAIIYTDWLTDEERSAILKRGKKAVDKLGYKVEWLDANQKDVFAYRDGFRHEDDVTKKYGCMALLIMFWMQTHQLPFVGNHIIWGEL